MQWTLFKRAVLMLCLALPICTTAQTLNKQDLDTLIALQKRSPSTTFEEFLLQSAANLPLVGSSVDAYMKRSSLSDDDLVNISRLLGVYTRETNRSAVVSLLEKMIPIQTVKLDGVPAHENPAIIEFGNLIEKLSKEFGLVYKNVDNRIFEVKLPGSGKDEFGVLTHADVVPVIREEWILPDGTKIDPFKLTRVGDFLYGRGTIDDKGSIASILYAMKAVKESGLPIERTIRLMIETTEESGGSGMRYYRSKVPLPEYNVVLDSRYPAVVAEKGMGALKVSFPLMMQNGRNVVITNMSGAASASTISQTATATLVSTEAPSIVSKLSAARSSFIEKYEPKGGHFSIDIDTQASVVTVKVQGVSAHGSRPEEGVNPLPRLALFLMDSGLSFESNGYSEAVRYINDLYATDYLGKTLGVAYKDDFMGPLTMSPTMIREKEGSVEVTTNVRMPRGTSPEQLKEKISGKILEWAGRNALRVDIDYQQGNWMARDPRGRWLSTLLNIFGEVTGLEAKPVSTAGGTTAKLMPNAINFGPAMPGKKYTAHNANEFKEISDLDLDMQMFVEMLVRVGNIKEMQ